MGRSSFDRRCPNASKHGQGRHALNSGQFLDLICSQLSRSVDVNFGPIGRHGSRGVPFKVVLESHGYTFIAKCAPEHFASHLSYEGAIYERLESLQGTHIPVHLGVIRLPQRYLYEGIADLTHAMFLSYAGTPIGRQLNPADREQAEEKAMESFEEIHRLGVVQNDAAPRNVLWDATNGQTMVIDFERAVIPRARVPLEVISTNRKRKMDGSMAKQGADVYARERNKFRFEIGLSRCGVVG